MSNKKYAVFTMDVEAFSDTECIQGCGMQFQDELLDGFDRYIDLLDKYGIKGTLFTVGKLAPKIQDRLRRCIRNGHRLALHSHDHTVPMSLPPEQFREQTGKAKKRLSNLFHTEVDGFRAPCFSLDRERLDILRELGFRYDSSLLDFPLARHAVKLDLSSFRQLRQGVFRQDDFYEFGLSSQNLLGHPFPISGGGYVRLAKWDVVRHLIRRHIDTNDYYVFYLHPFELTKERIPKVKSLKPHARYYLRMGIHSYARKVETIIQMLSRCGYQFVTFEELTQIMNKE